MRGSAVLMVDDRDENLLALEAVLEPTGCRLVKARSGDEALRALLRDDFAVILLDVQMPGLDGFETAELIRARERSCAVPIIFVTAISKEPHHVFRGYETGAVDYLFKPLDPVVLRSKVEVFVESYERGRALAEREELLRAMFEDAPIGMARADPEGRLRRVNRALCETLGRDAEQLVGRTLDELGPRADAGIDELQRGQLAAGDIARYEVQRRLSGPAGTAVPVLVSVSLTTAREGAAADLILHVQDLRERRRAERDREQLIRAQAARAQAEAASERLRLMQSIAVAALGAEDLEGLLREVLDRLLETLDVDRAAVVLTDGEQGVLARAASGVATTVQRNGARAFDDDVVAQVTGERGPVTVLDVAAAKLDASSLGPAVSSLLAVPLVVGAQVIGSLHVGTLTRREFDPETVDLLGLAAGRASLAIARTRLFERERRIAQELQRSLLPARLPPVPGVALAARYEPGGKGATVGGDWYDALALPGGRVAVVIGDVVGRGIEAAATMGQMRSALRAILMQADDTGAMADRLNRFALGLGDCVLTTVVLAIFEPATGRLRYTNAGHPPPLVLSPDGAGRYLEDVPAPPMGVVETPRYRQRTLLLEPGSTLLLFTDGLVEKSTQSLDAGLERLRTAALAADAGTDLDALCASVLGRLGDDATQADDVTMIALHALARLEDRVALQAAGDPGALTATRDTVRRWLAEAGADAIETHDITMATNEACQNAIEHAYELGADHFDVVLSRVGREVSVTVRDHGRWKTATSPDRGRGMDLMRELMDVVEVESGEGGSTVSLQRSLAAPRPVAVAAEGAAT
ncbi:MAG TPA: SpoIIE family protein phosphatase [Solirubrobacteraceae bacterium]